ncbi:hypothetical protein BDW74DRAFT_43417 [Aspergillus multicolor]|uniref:uncharacterized protein n=1 Tax=Aspergillus multicolor TaxID=41759 RepID=UPI003CCD57F2
MYRQTGALILVPLVLPSGIFSPDPNKKDSTSSALLCLCICLPPRPPRARGPNRVNRAAATTLKKRRRRCLLALTPGGVVCRRPLCSIVVTPYRSLVCTVTATFLVLSVVSQSSFPLWEALRLAI